LLLFYGGNMRAHLPEMGNMRTYNIIATMSVIIKPSNEKDLKCFLHTTTSLVIQTLHRKFRPSENMKFSMTVQVQLKTYNWIISIETEPKLFNHEDVLNDCLAMQEWLIMECKSHDIEQIISFTLEIIHTSDIKCYGCITEHPSQIQHMGVNGCLSMSETESIA
jgi:hypothetical protein